MAIQNKNELIRSIVNIRDEIHDLLEETDPSLLEQPMLSLDSIAETPVTIKDMLYQVTRLEAELIRFIWQIKQGQKATPSTILMPKEQLGEIRKTWYFEGLGRSLEQVLEDFYAVHNQIVLQTEDLANSYMTDKNRYPWLKGSSVIEIIEKNTVLYEHDLLASIKKWKASKA
jgi:hypothetical protein